MKLKDKVVIVTGSSSGIGEAIAKEFAKEGAKVVVNYSINSDAADSIVEGIVKDKGEAIAVQADVSKTEDVKKLINTTIEKFKAIDILVNNAGIIDDYAPVLDTSEELWDRTIAINLKGPFLCTKYALPHMIKKGKGVIVNIASISGHVAGGAGAAYTASKHGIIGLTKQTSFDYGQKGIRANAISPGTVETRMPKRPKDGDKPEVERNVPAGRTGNTEDIAKLALFLASEDSEFIHGTSVVIDGGWLAQ